jgi:hypothetical protein
MWVTQPPPPYPSDLLSSPPSFNIDTWTAATAATRLPGQVAHVWRWATDFLRRGEKRGFEVSELLDIATYLDI